MPSLEWRDPPVIVTGEAGFIGMKIGIGRYTAFRTTTGRQLATPSKGNLERTVLYYRNSTAYFP